jgi:hypothetical protein
MIRKRIAAVTAFVAFSLVAIGMADPAAAYGEGHGGIVGASASTDATSHFEARVYCVDGFQHIIT